MLRVSLMMLFPEIVDALVLAQLELASLRSQFKIIFEERLLRLFRVAWRDKGWFRRTGFSPF
jgi:hypothetical protein